MRLAFILLMIISSFSTLVISHPTFSSPRFCVCSTPNTSYASLTSLALPLTRALFSISRLITSSASASSVFKVLL
jgi:hypothetical protein